MKNFLLISLFLLLSVSSVMAQTSTRNAPGVYIQDEDGTNAARYRRLKMSNGSTTNNSDGSVSINTVGTITTTTKFCIDTDNDTCWFKTDNNTSVLTINDYVAIKMLRTTLAFHLLLDDGVGAFDLLLDDGSGSFTLVIE